VDEILGQQQIVVKGLSDYVGSVQGVTGCMILSNGEIGLIIDVDAILVKMKEKYRQEQVTDIDGVKIDFADRWVHLRKSNTEPIIRIYAEAPSMEEADQLARTITGDISSII
jgi:phosphomannomutase